MKHHVHGIRERRANKQSAASQRDVPATSRTDKPQMIDEPRPPFAEQHQDAPGVESKLQPRPRYRAERYKAAGKLEGKVALITGGDSGIGRAVAVLFAREGANVAITYLPEEQGDALETKKAVEQERRKCLLLSGDLEPLGFSGPF